MNKLFAACAVLLCGASQVYIPCDDMNVEIKYFSEKFVSAQKLIAPPRQPRCAIVPHHSAAAYLTAGFFRELAISRPDINNFIVVSPDHFRRGSASASVCSASFVCGDAVMQPDKSAVRKLSENGCVEENHVFAAEHGVKAEIPFIAKYFPSAKITAVALNDRLRNRAFCENMGSAIATLMKENPSAFLLVSSDFSHKGNVERTARNDEKSETCVKNLCAENIVSIECDNRAALYMLVRLLSDLAIKEVFVSGKSNSFLLGGPAEDITSYFYVCFL